MQSSACSRRGGRARGGRYNHGDCCARDNGINSAGPRSRSRQWVYLWSGGRIRRGGGYTRDSARHVVESSGKTKKLHGGIVKAGNI